MHSKDRELTALPDVLETQNQELLEAHEALHQPQKTTEGATELYELKAALEKEEEGKSIWWEKCDLLLSHEDAIYTKDV